MKQPKFTPWFDGEVKPVHVGVYPRNFTPNCAGADIGLCLWDGTQWMVWGHTPEEAARSLTTSIHQSLPWRGLAEQPKSGA